MNINKQIGILLFPFWLFWPLKQIRSWILKFIRICVIHIQWSPVSIELSLCTKEADIFFSKLQSSCSDDDDNDKEVLSSGCLCLYPYGDNIFFKSSIPVSVSLIYCSNPSLFSCSSCSPSFSLCINSPASAWIINISSFKVSKQKLAFSYV